MKGKINVFDIVYMLVGTSWLFLMIMSSGLYTVLKMELLMILFLTAICEIIVTKISIKKNTFIIMSIFILYFSLSLCYGILKGYEFSLQKDFQLIQNFIFTPICAVILAVVFAKNNYRIEFIWKILKYITLLLTVLDVTSILLNRNGIDLKILGFIKNYSNNMSDSRLELRVTNESSLMFLLPIYTYLFINGIKSKKIYGVILITGIIYSLISGRKMLEIIEILSILISIILAIKNSKISLNRLLKYIIEICLTIFIFNISVNLVSNILGSDNMFVIAKNTFINGFSSDAVGVIKRSDNASALMDMFWNSPIIGNGLNSYDINSLANLTTKWSYEIFYNALLAQSGIIGIIIFSIVIFKIISKIYKNYLKSGNVIYISIIIGFISFILCSSSNPMINFVWPWTIALIYAFNSSIKE